VRASTRPFTTITLYLSKRKEFNIGLQCKGAVIKIRIRRIRWGNGRLLFDEISIFSYSPGASIIKFRRFGDGPFDRAYLSSTGPEAATQPLGPRKSATECALSFERLEPSKMT